MVRWLPFLTLLAGCATWRAERFSRTQDIETARQSAIASAQEVGLSASTAPDGVTEFRRNLEEELPDACVSEAERKQAAEVAARAAAQPTPAVTVPRTYADGPLVAVFVPHDRAVELGAISSECAETLLADGRTYETPSFVGNDLGRFELSIASGALLRPDHAPVATVDAMVLGGGRVAGAGGGIDDPAWRTTLAIYGGVGGSGGPWGASFRAEVFAALGWSKTVAPVGTPITVSNRWRIDLGVGAFAGIRSGVDVTLAAHLEPYGGLYARAGWDVSDDVPTATFGARLDTLPSTWVVGAAVFGLLIYGLAHADWGDLLMCDPDSPKCGG